MARRMLCTSRIILAEFAGFAGHSCILLALCSHPSSRLDRSRAPSISDHRFRCNLRALQLALALAAFLEGRQRLRLMVHACGKRSADVGQLRVVRPRSTQHADLPALFPAPAPDHGRASMERCRALLPIGRSSPKKARAVDEETVIVGSAKLQSVLRDCGYSASCRAHGDGMIMGMGRATPGQHYASCLTDFQR